MIWDIICSSFYLLLYYISQSTFLFSLSALAGQCGQVWFTVSSLWRPIAASDKVIDAELEINWDFDCPARVRFPDAHIKVFTADPAHSNKLCLILLCIVFRKDSDQNWKSNANRIVQLTWIFYLPINYCIKYYIKKYNIYRYNL